MNPKVKICGITNVADALEAVGAGADALGFMFYEPSSRYISPEAAGAVIRELPPLIACVGVFVNATAEEVKRTQAAAGIDTFQFHGDESPEFCEGFGSRTIKAFRVLDESSLLEMPRFEVGAWLLDAYVPGHLGGTGATFNWNLATKAKASLGRPIILAGGLTVDNVERAVVEVAPYGLDVSSGVESAPGKKDASKMRDFINRAKAIHGAI